VMLHTIGSCVANDRYVIILFKFQAGRLAKDGGRTNHQNQNSKQQTLAGASHRNTSNTERSQITKNSSAAAFERYRLTH
jgi:hypothetical protein